MCSDALLAISRIGTWTSEKAFGMLFEEAYLGLEAMTSRKLPVKGRIHRRHLCVKEGSPTNTSSHIKNLRSVLWSQVC